MSRPMMELDKLLERALSLAAESEWETMAELLREHLADYDDEPAVHCWLGVAEREFGLEGVSYERFKRALSLNPEDPHVLATAGNGIAAFDDPDAEMALRTAALMAPDVAVTRLLYGAYLAREGFTADSLTHLEAALVLDPDDAQISYELGVARQLAGDVNGAVDAVGDAVSLEPHNGWNRVVLGLLLLEADRLEEAVGELTEGARLLPEDVEAQLLGALSASALGNDGLAYEMLERGRMRAAQEDLVLLDAIETQIDDGAEAALPFLMDEVAVDALRWRLQERP